MNSTRTGTLGGVRLLAYFLFGLNALCGVTSSSAQNAPIQLRAPWDDNDWWQPSTYLPDHSGTGLHTAVDFNYVLASSISSAWPYASELNDNGRNIRAAHAGTVQQTTEANSGGYGNEVVITSTENPRYKTRYGHLADYAGMANGTRVNAGDIIGHCGATGNVTGPHLHFELLLDGTRQMLDNLVLSNQTISVDFSRLQFPGTGNERYIGRPIQARSVGLGNDIYVDAGNNGTQSGTASNPFKTVTQAVDAASSTQAVTMHIKPGTYHENVTIRKNIRLVTWGSGTVRIGG